MTDQNTLQKEVVETLSKFYKDNTIGFLDIAMRTGKTKITIDFLKKKYRKDAYILIAYPDNKLKESWEKEFITWGYENPNVTFVNFSSLKNYLLYSWDFFIIDEFHSLSEKEKDLALVIKTDSNYTLLLSGTVSEETKNYWNVPCIYKYSTLQGIESGILADYKLTIHLVDLDTKRVTKNKQGKLKTEKQKYDGYTWVIEKLKREDKPYMQLALARNRLSLSSIGKLEYTRKLLKELKQNRTLVFTGLSKSADEIGIPSYHSKSKDDTNFKLFLEEKIDKLALAAIGKVGVTYPNLDSVILTNFSYNSEETAQILNRCIKLDYKNKVADLHIICLNEKPELKKIKESLNMLDQTKIKYE